jgi:hypothetical protein
VVAAGCGGTKSPGVANIATTTPTVTTPAASAAPPSSQGSPLQGAIRFSDCMRSHGVPNFPEPTAVPGGVRIAIEAGKGVNPQSAQFAHAQASCRKFAPEAGNGGGGGLQGQQLAVYVAHRLAFAACMRKRGIINFPDPDSQGDFHLEGTGVSQYSQTDMTAARACLPAADGTIQLPSSSTPGGQAQGQAQGRSGG